MEYKTTQEISKIWYMQPKEITYLCRKGKIEGAKKEGTHWLIPSNSKKPISNVNEENKKMLPLPLGITDYKKVVTQYYYVDKTLFIKDIIDDLPKASLFTRPYGFGKTLNMDMLRVFFEKTDEDTSIYFKDKLIWSCGQRYRDYQGKYPVIYLTFKDVKGSTWPDTLEKIREVLASEYVRHRELLKGKLSYSEKEHFNQIINKVASEVEMESSLLMLSKMLNDYYKSPAVIIIDDYNMPMTEAYANGFYNEINNFMGNLFSGGLKDNYYLAFGFMTDVLRVEKASMFSGLNNIIVNSILDDDYSQYFGFTKKEVKQLLKYYKVEDKFTEVSEWYGGYNFSSTEIFNPTSIINYMDQKCKKQVYSHFIGNNDTIRKMLSNASEDLIEKLPRLLAGEKVVAYIDTNITYSEIDKTSHNIFSVLLLSGYLRVEEIEPSFMGGLICEVALPNKEIRYIYEKEILDRL